MWPGASTTGNIYGIYDMSGGSYEYVMGAYAENGYPEIADSGFSTDPNVFTTGTINSKYYDLYVNATNSDDDDATRSCKNGTENGICYGHALSETSNWYEDESKMVTLEVSWFLKGRIL